MRRLKPHFVSLLLLFAVACQSQSIGPREQWAISRNALSLTESTLTTANQTQALSDQDFIATEPYVTATRSALQRADELLVQSNDKPTDPVNFYLDIASTTILKLKGIPTSQPSP